MVLNSFIIQMNGNHAGASGRGRASVSKLAQQLREGANEGGASAASRQGFWFRSPALGALRAAWPGAS